MPETVSLKEFLRTGCLGQIYLGLHQDEVAAILGQPDDVGGTSRKYRKPCIWKYGDVEFGFDRHTYQLNMILINFWKPKYPSGSETLQLNPSFIKGGVCFNEFISSLEAEEISYSEVEPLNPGTRQLTVGPGISLIFLEVKEECYDWIGLNKIVFSKRVRMMNSVEGG